MALVDYYSSGEEDGEPTSTTKTNKTASNKPPLKRKRSDTSPDLPPLPSKFHDLYASGTRVSTRDDPSLHGGRRRAIAHVEGNWPTHLYIEWYPSTTEYDALAALISSIQSGDLSPERPSSIIHSSLTSDLDAPLPLHISLSRSLGFSTEQKDYFLSSLEQGIKSSGIRPLDIHFTTLDWVPNFEKTRWFLVLRVQKPSSDGLNKLLHVGNKIVQEYGQPPLYASSTIHRERTPAKKSTSSWKKSDGTACSSKIDWSSLQDVSHAFHVSIAWTLEAPGVELLEITKSVSETCREKLSKIELQVGEIKVKIGNAVTNVPLPRGVLEGREIFVF